MGNHFFDRLANIRLANKRCNERQERRSGTSTYVPPPEKFELDRLVHINKGEFKGKVGRLVQYINGSMWRVKIAKDVYTKLDTSEMELVVTAAA